MLNKKILKVLNEDSQKKIYAGVIMCFRHKVKKVEYDDEDCYVYYFEVRVPLYDLSNSAPLWRRFYSLDEAVELEMVNIGFKDEVHLIKTWMPEGQRDKYIKVS